MLAKTFKIKVTCENSIFELINGIGKKERKSLSTIAHELILEALEQREDIYFAELACQREQDSSLYFLHDEAWQSCHSREGRNLTFMHLLAGSPPSRG